VISAEDALAAALPVAEVRGERDFRLAIFRLARRLKAVEELRDRPAKELRPVVRQWYERAAGRLGGRTLTDVYAEFISAWPAVRYAAGDDVVKLAWEMAQQQPRPPEAVNYDDDRVGLLMSLCIQLQHENELEGRGDSFYLSSHVAGKLLGVSQPTASKWLKMLVEDEVLEVLDEGGARRGGRRMAREYRLAKRP
jgi:hypothetical protein